MQWSGGGGRPPPPLTRYRGGPEDDDQATGGVGEACVVWEVEVRADDGSLHEVTVDAGDAGVLGSEVEDDDGAGDDD